VMSGALHCVRRETGETGDRRQGQGEGRERSVARRVERKGRERELWVPDGQEGGR
jgi:hypothetical protein